ncbi:replication associated protein, partial [Lake Sarah-associated circular virus-20]|uniref:replication associated protein n=1 Tax=Lake Sarah-associated circular virus-20 TaxID=1685747 RepID=UPI000777E66B
MADKSTRWAFTAYETQYPILDALHKQSSELIAEIGWQDEICPKTGKHHRQGYVRTVRQVRFSQLREIMPDIHLEKAKNWEALINYCQKSATRDLSGAMVSAKFERPLRLHEMLIDVAHHIYLSHRPGTKHAVCLDRQTDRQILLSYLREYSAALVSAHPEYAVVLVRQDARDAWCNYIEVWMHKAEQREEGDEVQ